MANSNKIMRAVWLALLAGEFKPGEGHDDKCDCLFQDVREYTNAYYGKTLRFRFCCLLAEFRKSWPHLFEEVEGWWDSEAKMWRVEPVHPGEQLDSMHGLLAEHVMVRHEAAKTKRSIRIVKADRKWREAHA